MTYLIAAYLLTQIGLGFVWHRSIRNVNERAEQTRADHLQVSADNARLRTMLASAEADLEAERESYAASLAKSIRQTEDARADAEWAHVLHAIVLGELDRHDTEHVCLPTLDGIRATHTTPMPHEDYLRIAGGRGLAKVTRLPKRGAK